MIVLYGWGTGKRGTIFNRRWRSVILGMLGPYLVFGFSMTPQIYLWGWSWHAGLALLALIAFDAVLLYGRWQAGRETGKPAQLRLTPRGYAQRTGFGRVRLWPWRRRMRIEMSSQDRRRYHIRYSVHFALRMSRLIDMQFDSDPTTAARIHKRINRWCAAAGR